MALEFDESVHYYGTLCKHGHDAGGGRSIRYKKHRFCVECQRAHSAKSYRKATSTDEGRQAWNEYCRAKNMKSRRGLSVGEFESLLDEQRGQCAICQKQDPGGQGTWHIDHCHETGNIRGLLCCNCNLGLGNFMDSPFFLECAASYLRMSKRVADGLDPVEVEDPDLELSGPRPYMQDCWRIL